VLWAVGAQPDTKIMGSIGGAVISSLSGFRINEVLQRLERISSIETFQFQLQAVDSQTLNNSEQQRLEDLLWRIAEKSIMG